VTGGYPGGTYTTTPTVTVTAQGGGAATTTITVETTVTLGSQGTHSAVTTVTALITQTTFHATMVTTTETTTTTTTTAETETIATVAGFTPFASLAAVIDNGGGTSPVGPAKRSERASGRKANRRSPAGAAQYPKSVTCLVIVDAYVHHGDTVTVTAKNTKTVTVPDPYATGAIVTVTSTLTITEGGAAGGYPVVTATITAPTLITLSIVGTVREFVTVTVTDPVPGPTVTSYDMCASNNLINRVGGIDLLWGGSIDFESDTVGDEAATDLLSCCAGCAEWPGVCGGFQWIPEIAQCTLYIARDPATECDPTHPIFQIWQKGIFTGPAENWTAVAGNGPCGQGVYNPFAPPFATPE